MLYRADDEDFDDIGSEAAGDFHFENGQPIWNDLASIDWRDVSERGLLDIGANACIYEELWWLETLVDSQIPSDVPLDVSCDRCPDCFNQPLTAPSGESGEQLEEGDQAPNPEKRSDEEADC
ncbi:hypothetical protein QR680_000820 [Steinernema hermaphroditum]|uniref:Uncharacterized protein n=1 Tax=Steinernema hermaphroditum TaxID=289476 RepID=A0AA39GYS5_9BILA|nr:hypothetical protein QR680_000820 [Steinernema hermaphroditum]